MDVTAVTSIGYFDERRPDFRALLVVQPAQVTDCSPCPRPALKALCRPAVRVADGAVVTPPRFLLVTGRKTEGVPAPRWPGGSGPFVGEIGIDGSWLAWRLAGANNRELGRSARVYPDAATCAMSIVTLRDGLPRAHALITIDHHSGLWAWQLEIDGATIAVSGRAYRRERECSYNLTQFVSVAQTVSVEAGSTGVNHPTLNMRHSWPHV